MAIPTGPASPDTRLIGTWRGVAVHVSAWDGVGARVDLSCACMFNRERAPMAGGLLHLDRALDGALSALRDDGAFAARAMQTVLLTVLPVAMASRTLLVIGLGDPDAWTADTSAAAVDIAVQAAIARGNASAAFAPSLLDAGVEPGADSSGRMIDALMTALDAQAWLVDRGLAARPALVDFHFDAGLLHIDAAQARFATAFARHAARRS